MDTPTRLNRMLAREDTPAGNLLKQARWIKRLDNALQEVLPEALKSHCQTGNIRGSDLILITDAPVWSTRLRYLAPTFLKHLNQRFSLNLLQIKVKIRQPDSDPQPPPAPHRAALSAQTAQHLTQLADSLKDDALGAALRRLATRRNR